MTGRQMPIHTKAPARETVAAILLSVGWVVFGLGWLAGLFLAWTSQRWTRTEKWLATALPLPALGFLLLAHALGQSHTFSSWTVSLIVFPGFVVSWCVAAWLVQLAGEPGVPRQTLG